MRSITRISIAGIAGAATLAALVGCTPGTDAPEEKNTLSLAVDSLYLGNWDPAQGGVGGFYFEWQTVFDSLTRWDTDTQTFEPWLAEEIEVSADRQTMTFTLRDDVTFVDGEKLDAAGVEKYYDSVLASEQYAYGGLIAGYDTEFTATGDYTLEMTTSKPIYPNDFYILLANGTPVLSPASVDDPELALSEALGSGPYLLDEVVTDAEATFVRNPDYWNAEAFPYDTIVLKVLADPIAKLNALKSGQIDVVPLQLSQVAEAEASGLTLVEAGGTFSALYVRDPKNSTIPALRDVRVRQAIAMAFDRESIAESIDLGYGVVSSQGFIPSQPEYVEGGDDRYAFDVEVARELMAEAGFADGFDVTLPVFTALSAGLEPVVQSSLAEIGIRVTYEPFMDYLEWFTAATSGDYPLIFDPSIVNTTTIRLLVEEFPGYGRLVAQDPEIDALVARIKQGTPEESAEAGVELGEKILDEALLVTVSRPLTFYGTVPEVTATASQIDGHLYLWDIQRAE